MKKWRKIKSKSSQNQVDVYKNHVDVYKNQDFVNCVYAHDEDNAESFCANESLLMATKNQLDRRASRGIASKRNRFSSFFGQWQNPFYGEN